MEITAFVVVCAIIFSILTPGNPVLNRYAPVLPGTEAWAYTGSRFNIGSQTAAETNRDMSSLMQGDEQAANNQAPGNVVNSGQGENIVNSQAPEGLVNGGQPQDAVNGQFPEGYVNGGQPQSPVEETEFFGRAKNPTALRSQKAFESGVGIIYALACMMILIAAWTMLLQDSNSNRRFRRKSRRRRRFWGR